MSYTGDDLITPFQIEGMSVRGRVARLGPLVNEVLTRHAYEEPVSVLLGEALTLAAMLGTALKFDGRFTLQTKGDGPVSMLVADYEAPGRLRGYAHVDEAGLKAAMEAGQVSAGELMGKGYLAMTIDQGKDMERYQGIVELDARGLAECAHAYFASSEQIATSIRLAVAPLFDRDEEGRGQTQWRAGAVMIQHLARDGGITGHREGEEEELPLTQEEKDWEHAAILLDTVEDHELLDPAVTPERLLFRLYHEDGVRVYPPHEVAFGCRCSHERMEDVLKRFSDDDIDEMAVDGAIETRCEFCNQSYQFDPAELKRLKEM
ncbi:Hsp33 family molecular chaperone [Tepidicaulis sp. LMO-SS28]|uniref:Hsp33 family molecular chaperone n=1 Tax=Tepidicaulis sp. LMO-SS28 TaxID=3447455 RepID=UPI003EE21304